MDYGAQAHCYCQTRAANQSKYLGRLVGDGKSLTGAGVIVCRRACYYCVQDKRMQEHAGQKDTKTSHIIGNRKD